MPKPKNEGKIPSPPAKIHPDTGSHSVDLETLNQFIGFILNSDELTPKAKEDGLKVVNNLKFIKVNFPYIAYAVSHLETTGECQRDKDMGVIRDFDKTSVHVFEYASPQEAVDALRGHIRDFEQAILDMRALGNDVLTHFANELEYDKKKGCVEARTIRALEYAGRAKSLEGRLDFDGLMRACYGKFDDDDSAANYRRAYEFFEPYLGLPCVVLKKDNVISKALIDDYMENILRQDSVSELGGNSKDEATAASLALSSSEKPQPDVQAYQNHTNGKCEISIGKSGMVQHWFFDAGTAQSFVTWLHEQNDLESQGVSKSSVKEEMQNGQQCYVVRLTQKQYELLSASNSYQAFYSGKQESSSASEKPTKRTILDIEKMAKEKLGRWWWFFNRKDLVSKALDSSSVSEKELITFINENSPLAIDAFLMMTGSHNLMPLHIVLGCRSAEVVTALVTKASREAIDIALVMMWHSKFKLQIKGRSKEGSSIIIFGFSYQPKWIEDKWTPLHVAARNQSAAGFMALVDKASSEAIDAALVIQDNEKWTVLHVAAWYQSAEAFIALVDKASAEGIDAALVIPDNVNKWAPLHYAARYQSAAGFMALVAKASAEGIDAALVMQANEKWTPLHSAASYQSAEAFMALVAKASAKVIDAALMMQDNVNKWTPLHYAARHQSAEAFMALVDKASAEAIDAALVMQTNYNDTPLVVAARHQSAAGFMALVDKASSEAIDAALVIQDNEKWTPLHVAAWYQSAAAFMALVDKASPEALSQAICRSPVFLQDVCSNQSEAVVYALLRKVSTAKDGNACLQTAIQGIVKQPGYLTRYIANYFCDQSHWINDAEFLQNLSVDAQPLRSKITHYICEHFIEGRITAIPQQIVPWLLDETRMWEQSPTAEQYAFNNYLQRIANGKSQEDDVPSSIRISQGEEIALNKHTLAAQVWKHGLASWLDYRLLRQQGNYLTQRVLDKLQHANLMLSGTGCDFTPQQEALYLETEAEKAFKKGEVLVKINRQKRWAEFLHMLEDYTFRPALRNKPPPDAKWKLHHLSGEIKSYQKTEKTKRNEEQTHTKKNSATYIRWLLDIRLFGQQEDGRPLVGMAFRIEESEFKALLTRDSGTTVHDWISDVYNVLENYRDKIGDVSYSDFDSFKEAVDKEPHSYNEVLAKLSREGALAIVIGRDTPQARQIALQRKHDVLKRLKIELPILFYDAEKQTIKPYDNEMQHEDKMREKIGRTYNLLQEQKIKARLLAVKKEITEQFDEAQPIPSKARKSLSFWQSKPVEKKLSISEAVLQEIGCAEAAERNHYDTNKQTWEQTEIKIRKRLISLKDEGASLSEDIKVILQMASQHGIIEASLAPTLTAPSGSS